MKSARHAVALVVDAEFGSKLIPLANRIHVWIVGTPANRAVAEEIWHLRAGIHSLESGVTTFLDHPAASPEELAGSLLAVIELHHGEYSHHPPWSVLEVYGASPTPKLRADLAEFGLTEISDSSECFIARAPNLDAA